MKNLRVVLLFISILFFFNLQAQQNHFIYIQTENKQPFYIKLDKQVLSSSVSGYIIMPKLKDGDYSFAIGFPKNEIQEQKMNCTISGKDLGYILKDFGDKGWGLFNMQTLEVVMSGSAPKKKDVAVETKNDNFSNLLSNVVNDPSIKEKEIAPVKEKVDEVVAKPVVVDSVVKQPEELVSRSVISRTLLTTNTDGAEMIYIDKSGDKTDIIRVFMPVVKKSEEQVVAKTEIPKLVDTTVKEVVPEASKTMVDTVLAKVEEKSAEIVVQPALKEVEKVVAVDSAKSVQNVNETVLVQSKEVKQEPKAEPLVTKDVTPMINSDCKSIATEDDFIKLRKKMVSGDTEDEMITIAKKAFKSKCFLVEQVKNLSVLFLKDAGKYAFFDAAYPFVSDSHYFSTLQNQLTDTYYITRFQAMIRH